MAFWQNITLVLLFLYSLSTLATFVASAVALIISLVHAAPTRVTLATYVAMSSIIALVTLVVFRQARAGAKVGQYHPLVIYRLTLATAILTVSAHSTTIPSDVFLKYPNTRVSGKLALRLGIISWFLGVYTLIMSTVSMAMAKTPPPLASGGQSSPIDPQTSTHLAKETV
ncbi:hypothetical protein XA68_17990 [Ophiocordyceps unilateralis]|uniref:Uncharacterized protein n=1 Tax=Ophiocordyceps unilateralis TaxID=268505 RepID=A0A2A9P333_OPHUN|nr:hypothetical protein XA68_17990 [Ophiocordyceps unilateralis]